MIDYAHNAMALESLLATIKEYEPNRLVCLFGCGGHVHTFDQQVTTSEYLASERTCDNKAKYFYEYGIFKK